MPAWDEFASDPRARTLRQLPGAQERGRVCRGAANPDGVVDGQSCSYHLVSAPEPGPEPADFGPFSHTIGTRSAKRRGPRRGSPPPTDPAAAFRVSVDQRTH
jgi:hypothetical protein